jgi:hypothetical protein
VRRGAAAKERIRQRRHGVVRSSRNSKDSHQGSGPRHVLVKEIGWPPRAMAKLLWHLLKRLATGRGHQTHTVWGSLPQAAIANFNLGSGDPCTPTLVLPCVARCCGWVGVSVSVRSPRRTRLLDAVCCCAVLWQQPARYYCLLLLLPQNNSMHACTPHSRPSRCADAPSRDTLPPTHYLHQAHSPTRVSSAFSWLPLLAG